MLQMEIYATNDTSTLREKKAVKESGRLLTS